MQDGSAYYKDDLDETKLNWFYLEELFDEIILTYKASTCNIDLEKDEVVIELDLLNQKKYLSNFIDNEITFKFNDDLVPLKIKTIINQDI